MVYTMTQHRQLFNPITYMRGVCDDTHTWTPDGRVMGLALRHGLVVSAPYTISHQTTREISPQASGLK